MPVKLCSAPRCPEYATYRGKCRGHARDRERQTNRAGKAIYNTAKWRHTRKAVLSREPLCPCGEIAVDVHHKVDLADGGAPYDLENLEGLCHACHSKETRSRVGTNTHS